MSEKYILILEVAHFFSCPLAISSCSSLTYLFNPHTLASLDFPYQCHRGGPAYLILLPVMDVVCVVFML